MAAAGKVRRRICAIALVGGVTGALTFVAPPKTAGDLPQASSASAATNPSQATSSSASRAVAVLGAVALSRTVRRATDTTADAEAAKDVTVSGGTAVARSWTQTAVRRMWTRADAWHVHAISGAIHTLIGFAYLLDVIVGDIVRLSGGEWSDHVSLEWVLLSMVFGAVNAVSGLQPSLMPQPTKDLAQLLGFGEDGNLQAAGFVNTAGFYFFLTYQSLRVLPDYPAWLQPLDPVLSAIAFLSIFHAIFIINSWVSRGKMTQGFAVGISAPLLLNVPVSLHLVLQGQWWVQELSRAYPGWPEVFFSANYALAWAGSMVTLVLSLYERKVCDLNQRALLTVLLGIICFTVIPLRAKLLVPQWFGDDWLVMLTLNPPSTM
mmetsp:Transcript_5765/g.10312  ORF Transcript_5765/g.10312 Transcript_5765/m.10312 type:complete len:377 (+) Transcript_5765:53-1183(+)